MNPYLTDRRRLDIRDALASTLLAVHEDLTPGTRVDVEAVMAVSHWLTHHATRDQISDTIATLTVIAEAGR